MQDLMFYLSASAYYLKLLPLYVYDKFLTGFT